jgi:DNA-binding protein HU-beta
MKSGFAGSEPLALFIHVEYVRAALLLPGISIHSGVTHVNKSELVEAIAGGTDLSKSQAERALNVTIEAINGALKKGDSVQLVGFGTFSVAKRNARKGKNPRTGEAIKIAARKVPKFTPGKGLKDLVNGVKKEAAKSAAKPAAKGGAKKAAAKKK